MYVQVASLVICVNEYYWLWLNQWWSFPYNQLLYSTQHELGRNGSCNMEEADGSQHLHFLWNVEMSTSGVFGDYCFRHSLLWLLSAAGILIAFGPQGVFLRRIFSRLSKRSLIACTGRRPVAASPMPTRFLLVQHRPHQTYQKIYHGNYCPLLFFISIHENSAKWKRCARIGFTVLVKQIPWVAS